MDFQRFGIDPRLAQAAEGLPTSFFFYEKMLTHAVELQENLCVKIALDEGREEVLLLPALQWLLSGEGRKALVVVPDAASAGRCAAAIGRLGSAAGLAVALVESVAGDEGDHADEGVAEDAGTLAPPSFRLQGDTSAPVLIGMIEELLALSSINLRDYGFLVVDGLDRLVDLPADAIRRFSGSLLPSWERRSVLAGARFSAKAKNLAWDLADNPSEISIEGEVAKAQSVLKETWNVPVESKLKFLLGLIEREKPARLCVFCNLKDTASEVSRRLAANGVRTDTIIGQLLPERKFALIEKFRAGDCTSLILTDEGAEGLTPGVFPLIVNYDFPLEPEFFVKRLEMLDRSDPAAKIVSLACDRYIAGLPAVEQYIDAKLDAVQADPSMLSAVDKSEGKGGDGRRPRGDAYPRDSRRGPNQRRDSNPRGGYPRDGNSRDGYPRDASNSPEIRKSISEATGGALDMNGILPPDSGYPAQAPKPRTEPRRGQERRERGNAGNKDSRRDDARRSGGRANKQPAQRPPAGKPGAGSPGPVSSGPVSSGPVSSGNPYAVPMEERMKLYRERYGHNLGEEKSGGGRNAQRNERKAQDNGQRNRQKGQRGGQPGNQGGGGQGSQGGGPKVQRGGQQNQGQKRGPSPQRDGGQRPPAPRDQNQRQPNQRPSRPAQGPEAPRAPQQSQSRPAAAPKPAGLVGRLLDALRKKKE